MYKQQILELSEELKIIRDYISLKFGSDFKDYCGLRGASELAKVIPSCSCQFGQSSPGRKRRRVDDDTVDDDSGRVEFQDELSNGSLSQNDCEGLGEIEISNQRSLRTSRQFGIEQDEIAAKDEDSLEDVEDDDPLDLDFEGNESNEALPVSSKICPVAPGDPNRHLHLGISYGTTKAGNEKLIYKSETFRSRNKGQRKPRTTNYWACIVNSCPGRLTVREESSGAIVNEKEHDHTIAKNRTTSSKAKAQAPKSKNIDNGSQSGDSDDSVSVEDPNLNDFDASFAKTVKGNERLIYEGYMFRPRRNNSTTGRKFWVCCTRNGKCKCTLIQESDKSITIKNPHTHSPNASTKANKKVGVKKRNLLRLYHLNEKAK